MRMYPIDQLNTYIRMFDPLQNARCFAQIDGEFVFEHSVHKTKRFKSYSDLINFVVAFCSDSRNGNVPKGINYPTSWIQFRDHGILSGSYQDIGLFELQKLKAVSDASRVGELLSISARQHTPSSAQNLAVQEIASAWFAMVVRFSLGHTLELEFSVLRSGFHPQDIYSTSDRAPVRWADEVRNLYIEDYQESSNRYATYLTDLYEFLKRYNVD